MEQECEENRYNHKMIKYKLWSDVVDRHVIIEIPVTLSRSHTNPVLGRFTFLSSVLRGYWKSNDSCQVIEPELLDNTADSH